MNFDKLFSWAAGIVIAAALAGNLDSLQHWILIAQVKTINASRTSNWGSPRFFQERQFTNSEIVLPLNLKTLKGNRTTKAKK